MKTFLGIVTISVAILLPINPARSCTFTLGEITGDTVSASWVVSGGDFSDLPQTLKIDVNLLKDNNIVDSQTVRISRDKVTSNSAGLWKANRSTSVTFSGVQGNSGFSVSITPINFENVNTQCVPEPTTIFGLLAMSGIAGTVIRKQKE